MIRRPITFDEKVNARFTPRSRSECWWWRGSFKEGRPAINLRHVTRYIYEREVAPIPPGMVLVRADHDSFCPRRGELCVHYRCVNPWHLRLQPSRGGLYEREVEHDLESPDRVAVYKRRMRANRNRDTSDTDQAEPENPKGLAPQ